MIKVCRPQRVFDCISEGLEDRMAVWWFALAFILLRPLCFVVWAGTGWIG